MKEVKPNFIDHIGIVVSDMEMAIDFYCNTIGFDLVQKVDLCKGETVEKGVGIPGAELKLAQLKMCDSDTVIELLQFIKPKGKPVSKKNRSNNLGIRHVAFNVDDLDGYYDRLVSRGVKLVSPGVMDSSTGEKFCYFYDPDGNILEFLKPPKESLKSVNT
jgi:catechol 2,3-dioxygenase-like lactoylglutathione lyase family enzyme